MSHCLIVQQPVALFLPYTGSGSKIGGCQGGALILGQAKPVLKEAEAPKGWAMQADPKSSGCPTKPGVPEERPVLWGKASAEPIFELRP